MRRPFRNRSTAVALFLVGLIALRYFARPAETGRFRFDDEQSYRVQRVVDGDTLLLAGGTRVRLIGVDTPELARDGRPDEPLAREASDFTRREVEGRDVTLEFDRDRRDRYHRVLAYVYVDGRMLNEELIRAGYSRAETRFSYRSDRKRRFQDAEAEAREHRRGLWAEEAGNRRQGARDTYSCDSTNRSRAAKPPGPPSRSGRGTACQAQPGRSRVSACGKTRNGEARSDPICRARPPAAAGDRMNAVTTNCAIRSAPVAYAPGSPSCDARPSIASIGNPHAHLALSGPLRYNPRPLSVPACRAATR
jgi:endonuclease YncB( thermonuclease family)